MTTTYDIPIIARGRIIMPGDDAIEFGGRAGAVFRAPDPHRHIRDLVLGNPADLADLAEMPTREIIAFLAELGPRLALERNPYLQDAYKLALDAGGLPETILRRVYDGLPGMFNVASMTELVERTIGTRFLDDWVEYDDGPWRNVRLRAVGTRQLHITAGNVPIVAAMTVMRAALTKSDCLIKSPSNDPLTANAIVRTLVEMDAEHPVTRHLAVAYWKGGDEYMDSQICRTSRIDKITAWGGMSSMKHIQKFLTPGLDLTAMNPKFSMSVVGREVLEDDAAREEAAIGIAVLAGMFNQTACANTRLVYVESDTSDESLDKVIAFGRAIHGAMQKLPENISTPAAGRNRDLEGELDAVSMEDELYFTIGNTVTGGVVVSRFPDRVDFYEQLNNRVVNIVPVADLRDVSRWCDDTTQTVGVYPERLRAELLNVLALSGVQRVVPLVGKDPDIVHDALFALPSGLPHDGIEPMRRGVRWVIDHQPTPEPAAPQPGAEVLAVV